MTPSAIIDHLGGASAVSAHCGVPVTTAANWKNRQSIPARYHRALLTMAARVGVSLTADQIADAHATDRAALGITFDALKATKPASSTTEAAA